MASPNAHLPEPPPYDVANVNPANLADLLREGCTPTGKNVSIAFLTQNRAIVTFSRRKPIESLTSCRKHSDLGVDRISIILRKRGTHPEFPMTFV